MKIQKSIIIGALLLLPLAAAARDGSSSGSGSGFDSSRDLQEAQAKLGETSRQFDDARQAAIDGANRRRLEAKNEVEKKKDEVCKRVTSRLDGRIGRASSHKQEIDQRYNAVEARWQRLIDRAKAKGVDAAKLEADLATFKEMQAKVDADFVALQAALQTTTNERCGYSNGDFKKSLSTANTQWKQLQADRKAIRVFRQKVQQEDIVPLLKALAAASTPSTTDNSTEKTQ